MCEFEVLAEGLLLTYRDVVFLIELLLSESTRSNTLQDTCEQVCENVVVVMYSADKTSAAELCLEARFYANSTAPPRGLLFIRPSKRGR